MNEAEWNDALARLAATADQVAVLSRGLDVGLRLRQWREAGTELAGASAADGLDQARGDLERLADGRAAEWLRLVERILDELPTPLE